MNECLICKHHYSQNGGCYMQAKNCLQFEEEARGKIVCKKVVYKISFYTEKIEPNKKYKFNENGQEFEAEVIKIHYVDLEKEEIGLEIVYHENDWTPKSDKKKLFQILK